MIKLHDKAGKKISMSAVIRPPLLIFTDPKLFFRENMQKFIEDVFKNFYISLSTTASGIGLVKIQGFASSVSFNVIQMV